METFLRLAGKTDYSTHVVVLINDTLIHYTWGGVVFCKQDYLLEPVWVVDLRLSELEYIDVINRALTLKDVLPRGFGHWWFKAFCWLFNRNQYLCTNFVCSILGYTMKEGITPDELYTWLSRA
jgi:hypothetical protein